MADNEGEEIVNNLLKQNFKKNANYISTNITLPISDGGTTQIDHILINEYGIFVIETKHFSGWIFGKETDLNWTQSFGNGQKFSFLNPIIQNKNHIKHLRQHLPSIPEKVFQSIVVFSGTAEFKTALIRNVVKPEDLVKHIKQFKEKTLSLSEVETSIGKIEFKRKKQSLETDAAHIEYVQNKLKKKDAKEVEYMSGKPPKVWQDIPVSPRRETAKLDKNSKSIMFFFIKIAFTLITACIVWFGVQAVLKTMQDDLISKAQKNQQSPPILLPTNKRPQSIRNFIDEKEEAEKQAKAAELKRFKEEIAQHQAAERKKAEFEKKFKPRPECNNPNLEWAKFVECTDDKMDAWENFSKNH